LNFIAFNITDKHSLTYYAPKKVNFIFKMNSHCDRSLFLL